jgi:hypothetical protein
MHDTKLQGGSEGCKMLGRQGAFPSGKDRPTYRERLRAFNATTKVIIKGPSEPRMRPLGAHSECDEGPVQHRFERLAGECRRGILHNVR